MTIDDAVRTNVLPSTPVNELALVAPPEVLTVTVKKPVAKKIVPTDPAAVHRMVVRAFPDAPVMVLVAKAESSFNPFAKNPNSTARGVFQILHGTWIGYRCAGSRTNAADNIACARKIYDAEGTSPWNASRGSWGELAANL